MPSLIHYLNTDLDLASPHDLSALTAHLDRAGLTVLDSQRRDDGLWHAIVETLEPFDEPEDSIAALLDVIESLPQPRRADWDACTLRDFNLGFDCGDGPWEYNKGLATDLLRRIVSVGGSVRVTIYPQTHDAGAAF